MLSIDPNAQGDEPAVEFGPTPIPAPLERVIVLRAAGKLGTVLNELLRYMVQGENSATYAFEDEVVTLLADILRKVIEIERPRMELCSVVTQAEIDTTEALHAAILAFQKEWGYA